MQRSKAATSRTANQTVASPSEPECLVSKKTFDLSANRSELWQDFKMQTVAGNARRQKNTRNAFGERVMSQDVTNAAQPIGDYGQAWTRSKRRSIQVN